jgi:hypothetical protein
MDIDLMGRTDNSLEHIRFVVEEICGLAVEQDGVEFSRTRRRYGIDCPPPDRERPKIQGRVVGRKA